MLVSLVFIAGMYPFLAKAETVSDVQLPARNNDKGYHILYRLTDSEQWQYAVRDISNNIKNFRISGLVPGKKYEYTVVSVEIDGDTRVAQKKVLKTYKQEAGSNMEKGKTYKAVGVNSVRIEWRFSNNAVKYNVYYRERFAEKWRHSIPNLSQTTDRVTIKSLNPSRAYVYKVTGVDKKGREFSVISERELRVKK